MAKFSVYPPLDSLVDLACRDGVDIRPTLLRVLTDLYVQKPAHSGEEEAQYVALALGLIQSVDGSTRATVTATLSVYRAAPASILDALAALPSTPADPGPVSFRDLTESFFTASAQERCLILTNLDVGPETATRRLPPPSTEIIRRLETAALQRNTGEFIRVLERALGISRALAERVTRDYSGEPVVVAAKALGMKADVLQRILLFLNPAVGQSVERVFELARLFDEISPAAAERMLAIWRLSSVRRPASQAPVFWNDERRDARSLTSTGRHPLERGREQKQERLKTSGR